MDPSTFVNWFSLVYHMQDKSLQSEMKDMLITHFRERSGEYTYFLLRSIFQTHQDDEMLEMKSLAEEGEVRSQCLQVYQSFQEHYFLKIYVLGMNRLNIVKLLEEQELQHGMYAIYVFDEGQNLIWSSDDFVEESPYKFRMQQSSKTRERRIYFICNIRPPSSLERKLQDTLVSGHILKGLQSIKDWNYLAIAYSISVIEFVTDAEESDEELHVDLFALSFICEIL